MPEITPLQMCGLCLVTESNLRHEWPFIAWTIRRRVEANRLKEFGGDTLIGVILKRKQFSAFNGFTGTPEQIYRQVRESRDKKGRIRYTDAQLAAAEECASLVMVAPEESALIPRKSFYYFSPISMDPIGSLPPWNWSILRRYCWDRSIDPYRFTAAYEI